MHEVESTAQRKGREIAKDTLIQPLALAFSFADWRPLRFKKLALLGASFPPLALLR